MAYGLPARGQANWDDELNNSLEALKATADAADGRSTSALSTAVSAASTATAAAASAALAATAAQVAASAASTPTAMLANLARNPDLIISGAVTRDANGAATSAPVTWPDGAVGTYTADAVSAAFPGAVDAYHITYVGAVTRTYTQPLVTRDSTGAAVTVPQIVVS